MMNKPAAISGALVDMKNVATHKCLRLTIDVPAECAMEVIAAMGWPTGVAPVMVAVARLNVAGVSPTGRQGEDAGGNAPPPLETPSAGAPVAGQGPSDASAAPAAQTAPPFSLSRADDARRDANARRAWADLPYAEQAGIRCLEPLFLRFLRETWEIPDEDVYEAIQFVRRHCGVKSRAELIKGTPAGTRWNNLERAFQAWLNAPVSA